MLQVTPHMRILVCIQPVDFRKGIDGIAAVFATTLDKIPTQEPCSFFTAALNALLKFSCTTDRGSGFVQSVFLKENLIGGLKISLRPFTFNLGIYRRFLEMETPPWLLSEKIGAQ